MLYGPQRMARAMLDFACRTGTFSFPPLRSTASRLTSDAGASLGFALELAYRFLHHTPSPVDCMPRLGISTWVCPFKERRRRACSEKVRPTGKAI